jgi:hypothetical protein
MKRGDLVEYIHWKEDSLLTPRIKVGMVLEEPNEVGKMRVIFGTQKMWVWSGDLRILKSANR